MQSKLLALSVSHVVNINTLTFQGGSGWHILTKHQYLFFILLSVNNVFMFTQWAALRFMRS